MQIDAEITEWIDGESATGFSKRRTLLVLDEDGKVAETLADDGSDTFRALAAYADRTARTKRVKAIRDRWASNLSLGDFDRIRLDLDPA